MAFSGIKACVRLFLLMREPNLANFPAMSSSSSGLNSSFCPPALATPCRVISSTVGPNPPVVMITSTRLNASLITSVIRCSSSPTVALYNTRSPVLRSCVVINTELVSKISESPESSSSPIEIISARMIFCISPAQIIDACFCRGRTCPALSLFHPYGLSPVYHQSQPIHHDDQRAALVPHNPKWQLQLKAQRADHQHTDHAERKRNVLPDNAACASAQVNGIGDVAQVVGHQHHIGGFQRHIGPGGPPRHASFRPR